MDLVTLDGVSLGNVSCPGGIRRRIGQCGSVWPRVGVPEGGPLWIRWGGPQGDPGGEVATQGENLHVGRCDEWGRVPFVRHGRQQ